MICSNCGMLNSDSSKFCIRCGKPLVNNNMEGVTSIPNNEPINIQNQVINQGQEINNVYSEQVTQQTQNINSNYSQPNMNTNYSQEIPVNNNVNYQNNIYTQPAQPNYNNIQSNSVKAESVSIGSIFFIILAFMLKPFTALKEELNKFNSFKNSAILALIVSGCATIMSLIKEMLSVVRVKSFSWSSGGYTTTWVWENLKELNYFKVIGKNLLIYMGVIIAIGGIYYLASLIIKKQSSFAKLIGISAMAIVPMIICSLVLSPILGMIWDKLTMPVIIIGAIYTIILVYEGIDSELQLDGNIKCYVNLVCLSILGIAAYYLYIKLFTSSITSGLGNLMDLFG